MKRAEKKVEQEGSNFIIKEEIGIVQSKKIKAERRHNENYKILKIRYERQDLCPVYIYLPSLSYLHGIIVLAHSMDVGLGHKACFGQLEYGQSYSMSVLYPGLWKLLIPIRRRTWPR